MIATFASLRLASQRQRAKLFKAGVGRDEARRGRSETQVQIRKEKKEERLNQRRRKGSAGDTVNAFALGAIPEGGAPVAGNNAAVDQAAHMRVIVILDPLLYLCCCCSVICPMVFPGAWLFRDFDGNRRIKQWIWPKRHSQSLGGIVWMTEIDRLSGSS